MSKVKVSIIIPVYNMEKYLRQCLDSIIYQTLKDLEIICIDDCSTDNSPKILKEYAHKDARIKILTLDENSGQGVARNEGLHIAQGDYIMFCDPDDWYELDACEKAYNKISSNNNDICFFSFYRYNENTRTKTQNIRRIECFKTVNKNQIDLSTINSQIIQGAYVWSQIYNRKFIINNNICFTPTKICEDCPFYIKAIVYANSASVIEEALCNYRRYRTTSHPRFLKKWSEIVENKNLGLDIVFNSNKREKFIKQVCVYTIYTTLNHYKKITAEEKYCKKDIFNAYKKLYTKINANYNVENLKKDIDYSHLKIWLSSKTWYEYELKEFVLSNIFSIKYSEDKTHKIIKLLGITIKLKVKTI